MRRIVFNTAAIISLMLCLFFIYACLRSFLPTNVRLSSVDGSLMIFCWDGPVPSDGRDEEYNPASEKFAGIRTMLKMMSHQSEWQFLGFRSIKGGGLFRGVSYQVYAIPYWILIPLTAILPILWRAIFAASECAQLPATASPAAMTCANQKTNV